MRSARWVIAARLRPRLRHRPLQLAVVALLAATATAHAELHRLALAGEVEGPNGKRPASLHLLCEPDPNGGAISVELWLPQAFELKDFDYDDFEGPDAPAGERELSRLRLAGAAAPLEIAHAAAGWYSGEDPDTFVFGLSQRSHQPGSIAKLLAAIDEKSTSLLWTQKGFGADKRQLRATFALDQAAVGHIRETVGPCLAAASPGKGRATTQPRRRQN